MKELREPHGQERRVRDNEIGVERREQREQVHHRFLAAPVRKVERDRLDLGQELADLRDAGFRRPITVPGDEGALVEADEVASLCDRRGHDRARDGDARELESMRSGRRLGTSALLAGTEQDRAVLGDEAGIEGIDGVGIIVEGLRDHDLGTGVLEERAERLVLGQEPRRVGLGSPAVLGPQRAGWNARPPHEHAAEGLRHRATAEFGHGEPPYPSRPTRSAEGGNRTHTGRSPLDFESSASASSATSA